MRKHDFLYQKNENGAMAAKEDTWQAREVIVGFFYVDGGLEALPSEGGRSWSGIVVVIGGWIGCPLVLAKASPPQLPACISNVGHVLPPLSGVAKSTGLAQTL